MGLLRAAADPGVIALGLGHESAGIPHGYVKPDLTMMETAVG